MILLSYDLILNLNTQVSRCLDCFSKMHLKVNKTPGMGVCEILGQVEELFFVLENVWVYSNSKNICQLKSFEKDS